MNDFARVNVYLADTAIVEMVETPAYPLDIPISDIGEQLNLCVRMGIVTVSEAITVVWQLYRYCCRRRRPQPL